MRPPVVTLALASLAISACSGPGGANEPQVLRIVGTEFAFDAPTTIESGVTLVRFENEGASERHHAALARLERGHSIEDLLSYMRQTGEAPDWVVHVGGPESIAPGDTSEAIVLLEPGLHVILCYVGEARGGPHWAAGMVAPLEVTDDRRSTQEPQADVELSMFDYGYELSKPLQAGRQTLRVVNAGPQVHNVLTWRLKEGKTADDVLEWLESERSDPVPGYDLGGITALSVGQRAYLELDLAPGAYAFFCMVPDEQDRRPHVMHGMLDEVRIE